MKALQKTVSLLLVLALVFTLGLSAFAANDNEHTITITNPDAGEAHTYSAYQIFAGDYNGTILSNISWGKDVDGDALLAGLKAELDDFDACENALQVVKVLSEYDNGSAELRAFAAVVDKYVTTPSDTATGDAANPAVLNVVGDGYYYVKDVSENLTVDTYSDYILLVEGDVEVEAKDTTGVLSYKKVKDINDSTDPVGGYTDWQDSADYDILDPVPFLFHGTVAADYDKYESYTLIFHDIQSAGLTFDHIDRVTVDGEEIDFMPIVSQACEDGCTFEVIFENLKEIPEVKGGSIIEVEYTSILNENAVIGELGNPNEMYMEYSNNPTDATSTGKTPNDKVIVFTYEIIVDKVDEEGNPVDGAEFTLEKWVIDEEYPEGHWVVVPGGLDNSDPTGEGDIYEINGLPVRTYTDPATGAEYYVVNDLPDGSDSPFDLYLPKSIVDSMTPAMMGMGVPYMKMENGHLVSAGGNFTYAIKSIERRAENDNRYSWKGIDDGHYRITETVTPPGYNTMDPVIFDVVAEHDEESQDPKLISCVGVDDKDAAEPVVIFEHIASDLGILHAFMINTSGGELPTTGGIGTTLFYVLGALLVLGAGVLLVVKKFSDAN